MNRLLNYFDLNKSLTKRVTRSGKIESTANSVIPQYLALIVGIVAQPFLQSYQQTGNWPIFYTILGRLVFGLLVGVAIFPAVYKRAWDNSNPLFIQLCSIFSAGLGWQTLFATAVAGAIRH